jgi:hypothetical protein
MGPVSVLGEGRDVRRRGVDEDRPRPTKASGAAEAVAFCARGKAMAAATRHRDGRRRLAQHLQDEGCHGGRAKARRWMNKTGGAVPRPRRRGPMTTDSRPGEAVAPPLWARQVDVTAPEPGWAGEIPDRWTAEGGL